VSVQYPEIEPYDHGLLNAGDGQHLYWETCGNPAGQPAVVLHGGPGSGCTPGLRRYFDPAAYRIVLFDQRGAGRSLPHAGDPGTSLAANTTRHLLADLERLREHLGVGRWLVYGQSWGTTLGLAYAERYPHRVSGLVLLSTVTTTAREVEWITRDMGRVFPAEWARFRDGVAPAERDGNLAAAYHRLLEGPDLAVREQAARDWCAWEDTHVATHPGYQPSPRYADPRFRLGFARIVTRYFAHAAWLPDGILLRETHRLAGIPGVLIHGRLDISGPADIPWRLAQAWRDAELTIIDVAGHGGGPALTEAVIAATDRFARSR
jgi:proline iminopeptidase